MTKTIGPREAAMRAQREADFAEKTKPVDPRQRARQAFDAAGKVPAVKPKRSKRAKHK